MALQGQMPLNLPENSLLDGLFTSGLRFVSTYPGLATSGRVATARYEMLHLTEPGHSLAPPIGGNREFLIPTQLHEVFCWVHQECISRPISYPSLNCTFILFSIFFCRDWIKPFDGCNVVDIVNF